MTDQTSGTHFTKYVAFHHDHMRIISVGATSEAEAIEKITEQLNRPGRYGEYRAWVDGGRVVRVEVTK